MKIYSCLLIILFVSSCFNEKIDDKKEQIVYPKQELEIKKETASTGEINTKIMNNEEIHTQVINTWITSTGEIIFPVNEKTTSAEQEFSSDLNGLLNLVNEDSNER